MKKASRFMPEYQPKQANATWVWLLGVFLLVILVYEPFIIAVLAALIVIGYIWSRIETPKIERYFLKLLEQRSDLSICEFAREFNPREVDTWVIRATYEQVQSWLPTDLVIPIKSSDDLFEDLKIEAEDFELDMVHEIAQRTGRTLDNCEQNPYFGKVNTVRGLVMFFNSQPLKQTT